LLGAAVVFFLFASIGFVTLQMGTGAHSGWDIFLSVALSGGFAVRYATFGIFGAQSDDQTVLLARHLRLPD